jgi:spore cortex biosynthesis protein YabQ
VTLYTQFVSMGFMLACGLALGVIFDTYRVLTGQLRVPRWLISFLDLLYWTGATLLVFKVLYFSNQGQLRLFVFVGLLGGMLLYFMWISRSIIQLVLWIIRLVKLLIRFIWWVIGIVIITPIMAVYKFSIVFLGFFLAIAIFLYKIMLQLVYPIRFLFCLLYNMINKRMTWPRWVVLTKRKCIRFLQRIIDFF